VIVARVPFPPENLAAHLGDFLVPPTACHGYSAAAGGVRVLLQGIDELRPAELESVGGGASVRLIESCCDCLQPFAQPSMSDRPFGSIMDCDLRYFAASEHRRLAGSFEP